MADSVSTNSLPKRQIILVSAITAAFAVVMLLVYFFAFRTSYAVLLDGLRPADAAAIVGELKKRKLPYRLEKQGTTILVPDTLVDDTRLAIAGSDLPLKGEVGFELFNKSDLGLTEFAQKINYQRALQGELARTITALDGIESARVHLSLPEQTIFQRDQSQAKASVMVTPRPGITLVAEQIAGIQRLIASAVPQLDPTAVVVLDGRGDVVSLTPAPADPSTQQKLAVEQYYAGRVRAALQMLGHDSEVSVAAMPLPATISTAAPPLSASGREAPRTKGSNGSGRDDLSAVRRSYGLHVVLAPKMQLGAEEQTRLLEIASRTIGFDPAKGDTMQIDNSHASAPATATLGANAPDTFRARSTSTPNDGRAAEAYGSSGLKWAVFGGALVTLLIGLVWWRVRQRPLSQARRDEISMQLAHLLARHRESSIDGR